MVFFFYSVKIKMVVVYRNVKCLLIYNYINIVNSMFKSSVIKLYPVVK